MVVESTAGKIVLIALAAVGALTVLNVIGMFFMHFTMMGDSPFYGLTSFMPQIRRGMMGG